MWPGRSSSSPLRSKIARKFCVIPSAVPDANGGGFDIAAIDRVVDRSRSLESTVLDLAMLVLGVDFERGGELSSHRRADVAARCSVSLGRLAPVE